MPTSANIDVVLCKRKQQVTTLLGPIVLGVVGQQCCVRLHGPLESNFKIFSNEPLHKIDNITISLSGLVKFN